MKPTPLKKYTFVLGENLIHYKRKDMNVFNSTEVYLPNDIKAAVEWLKFKLNDTGVYEGQEWQRVADLIREAFPHIQNIT